MTYRTVAIRVLYFSLAFAALTGIAAVFVPSSNSIIWRLLGTALTTGVTASFLLLSVRALENPSTRPLGSTIGIIVCIVYPLVLSVIWLDAIGSIPNKLIGNLALSALIIFLSGFPLMLGSACITHRKLKKSGILLLISWVILPIIWIIDVWSDTFGSGIYLETIAQPIAWCSAIAALLLINWPRHLIGLVLITIVCLLWQWFGFKAHFDWALYPTPLAIILIIGWAPCSLSLWSLLTIRKKGYGVPAYEIAASCFGSLAIGLCFAFAWTTITKIDTDLLLRLAIASSILGGTSVLGVFITQVLKMSMLVKGDGTPLNITCPRCHNELSIPQGKSTCPNCGLRFKLLFESPNCRSCEYDLTHTKVRCCPECGEQISTLTIQ